MKKIFKDLLVVSLLTGITTASALENEKQINSDKKVWISIGNDAVKMITNSKNKPFNFYIHPWEVDSIPSPGLTFVSGLRQNVGLKNNLKKGQKIVIFYAPSKEKRIVSTML